MRLSKKKRRDHIACTKETWRSRTAFTTAIKPICRKELTLATFVKLLDFRVCQQYRPTTVTAGLRPSRSPKPISPLPESGHCERQEAGRGAPRADLIAAAGKQPCCAACSGKVAALSSVPRR